MKKKKKSYFIKIFFVFLIFEFFKLFNILIVEGNSGNINNLTNTSLPTDLDNSTVTTNVSDLGSQTDNQGYAGEFFGIKVPIGNYYFIKATIERFGNKLGRQPQNEEEKEELIWEQLLLSFIAFNENITVSDEELELAIREVLKNENVDFDFKTDKDNYKEWTEKRLKETPEVFENQLKHLIQIEKLRKNILEKIEPKLEDEQVYKEFLKEYGMLNLEIAKFDTEKEADEFYKKVAGRTNLWEKEKKKNPKIFLKTGLVSIAFLVDIWKIPQDAALNMLKRNISDTYPTRPIYKGYGVFKILEKNVASEEKFEAVKGESLEKLKQRKKISAFEEWLKNLKAQANLKIYEKKN
ncbi:MAG: hypothetical protein NC935_07785 [Candidatus Omnitrophica bacterium]|nr:hypothetical protein [Candidatus Omnitrophota bacterium]